MGSFQVDGVPRGFFLSGAVGQRQGSGRAARAVPAARGGKATTRAAADALSEALAGTDAFELLTKCTSEIEQLPWVTITHTKNGEALEDLGALVRAVDASRPAAWRRGSRAS